MKYILLLDRDFEFESRAMVKSIVFDVDLVSYHEYTGQAYVTMILKTLIK